MKNLSPLALERRRNAKITNVAFLAAFFGLFTTVPVSIRQKDWRLWCFPFFAALTVMLCGTVQETETERTIWQLVACGTQGGLCALLVKQNKEEALQQRDDA